MHDDDVMCGDMTRNGRVFVTGGTSCVVKVWRRPNRTKKEKVDTLVLAAALCGHSDAVLSVAVSQEFSIIVTGSADCTCIEWDLNRLSYVRSLTKHSSPVTTVAISSTTGDILSVDRNIVGGSGNNGGGAGNGSRLHLWNINGEVLVEPVTSPDKVTCAIFTSGMEGVVQNMVVTGLENGNIKFWSSWDLTALMTITPAHQAPVTALAISKDSTQLISGDASGVLMFSSSKKPRENYMSIGIKF